MSVSRAKVSSAARWDVLETSRAIRKNSPRSAERFLEAFQTTLGSIVEYPDSGVPVETSAPDLIGCRSWPTRGFENWRIYYRVTDDAVRVARVLHVARDLESID